MAFFKALILLTFLSLFTSQTQAQAPTPAPSGPVNLTAILEKGGQFTTLLRLLKESQQLIQIQSQLNSTTEGFTLFAPTDNAFQNLKSGAINDLTDAQKVKFILFHVAPKYYTLADLQTVSNPVRTQATEKQGSWGLYFSGQGNQVNVSTKVVTTPINNALRQQFPLAVYQVDKVLLPQELFGAKSPSSAPAPKSSDTSPSDDTSSSDGKKKGGASTPAVSQKDNGAAGRNVGLGLVLGLISMAALS